MKRILIDTNIVIDLLAKRNPFYESASKLFSLADKNKIRLSVSSLTIANTNYILSAILNPNETKETLRRFRVLVEIIPLTEKIIDLALNDPGFQDFEDGLQYYSAIESNKNMVITRDLKGFKSSTLPVMSAEQYLNTLS